MSANDRQEGGNHYGGGELQHWDVVRIFNLDYFQGQISKYIFRWKNKGKTPEARLLDLKKARHFLDKYIEIEEGRPAPPQMNLVEKAPTKEEIMEEMRRQYKADAAKAFSNYTTGPNTHTLGGYEKDNPQYLHDNSFLCEGGYGDGKNLYRCRTCRKMFTATGLVDAHQTHQTCRA